MFTIGIKGKGYYSGFKRSGANRKVTAERQNVGEFKVDKITASSYIEDLISITVTIPMKRIIDEIDNRYIYSTREEAERALENIKNSLEYDSDRSYYYDTSKSWRSGRMETSKAHASLTRHIKSKAWKVYDQLEILNEEVTIKKKSRFNIKNFSGRIEVNTFTSRTCQFCNIEISKEEPFYRSYEFDLCNHCVQNIANELGSQFNACKNNAEWSSAWLAERVVRDI